MRKEGVSGEHKFYLNEIWSLSARLHCTGMEYWDMATVTNMYHGSSFQICVKLKVTWEN